MHNRLMATRYTGATYDSLEPTESLGELSELGIKWSLLGGIIRAEITVRATSKRDAYHRYKYHLGDKIAIYDNFLDKYLGVQAYEIIPDGRFVTYICAGPWKRTYDGLYLLADMEDITPTTADIATVIKDILDDRVTITSTDQTNIDNASVAVLGWTPNINGGTRAGDCIAQLAAIGNSSNMPMDFYFVHPSFDPSGGMSLPLPYFKARSTTANPDWQFYLEDLAPGGLALGRHVWDLKTQVDIGYGRLVTTHTGANDLAYLISSTDDFVALGVSPGDPLVNLTDGTGRAYIIDSITTTTNDNDTINVTETGTPAADFDTGDKVSITLKNPMYTGQVAHADAAAWWDVEYNELRSEMDQTQAAAYQQLLLNIYHDAVQQSAFTLGAPKIRDTSGFLWPLWRPLFGDSFYFRCNDLFPGTGIIGNSDDRAQTFMAIMMDYTYSNNRLRVVPSTGDSRLDSILNQSRMINGWIIDTTTKSRATGSSGQGGSSGGWLGNESWLEGIWAQTGWPGPFSTWYVKTYLPGNPGGSEAAGYAAWLDALEKWMASLPPDIKAMLQQWRPFMAGKLPGQDDRPVNKPMPPGLP